MVFLYNFLVNIMFVLLFKDVFLLFDIDLSVLVMYMFLFIVIVVLTRGCFSSFNVFAAFIVRAANVLVFFMFLSVVYVCVCVNV